MILLTGATGAAGLCIADEFVEQRVPVRILAREKAKARRLENVATIEMQSDKFESIRVQAVCLSLKHRSSPTNQGGHA